MHNRACVALLALLSAGVLGACGVDHEAAVVAKPVKPPPLTSTARNLTASGPDLSSAATPDGGASEKPTDANLDPGGGGILTASDRESFAALASQLSGQVGLAVSRLGFRRPVEQLGSLRTAVAWSTSKVPVAMAVIAAGDQQAQQANLQAAITASDNAAALRLWASLGSPDAAAAAADQQLRAAGDDNTRVQASVLRTGYTPFGQTAWSIRDQARFAAGLACTPAGPPVLALMNEIIPSERWGMGDAGVSAQLKGGWGPGSQPGVGGGYLARQFGVMIIRGAPVAVAIAALPADGSFDTATSDLTTMARWLMAHAHVAGLSHLAQC